MFASNSQLFLSLNSNSKFLYRFRAHISERYIRKSITRLWIFELLNAQSKKFHQHSFIRYKKTCQNPSTDMKASTGQNIIKTSCEVYYIRDYIYNTRKVKYHTRTKEPVSYSACQNICSLGRILHPIKSIISATNIVSIKYFNKTNRTLWLFNIHKLKELQMRAYVTN